MQIIRYILIFLLCFNLYSIDWFNTRERELKELSKEDLIELVLSHEKKINTSATLNNKLSKKLLKVTEKLEQYKKRPRLWFWRSPVFGITAGLSGMLNPINILQSNLDILFMCNFYSKYLYYTIGYLPFNKQIMLGIGFYF